MSPIGNHVHSKWFVAVALLLTGGLANPVRGQAGPTSPYYLTAGDQGHILVVQGALVTATYSAVNTAEYPIAAFTNALRTSGSSSGVLGHEYTLAGLPTGLTFPLPATVGNVFDATTDGTFNYIVSYTQGTVYRLNLDFTNPVQLFTGLGSSAALTITYDPVSNSLWIAGWNNNVVTDYSMTGTVLSSFSATVVSGSLSCLALDPATNTLWMGSQQTQTTFYEYSKAGTLLQSVTYSALAGENTLGGEFAFAAIPEPGTWALLALGALALSRPWRKRSHSRRS